MYDTSPEIYIRPTRTATEILTDTGLLVANESLQPMMLLQQYWHN